MKQTDIPSNILSVFANSATTGYINSIQQTDPGNGHASFALGFPPVTFQDVAAGGQPPFGSDFNGILNLLSAHDRWVNSGAVYPYDSTLSAAIGGYPKGAKVGNATGDGTWMSTVDDNTTDPSSDTSGKWVPIDNNGVASVSLAGTNVTLTPSQYQKKIVLLTGTLTANVQVVFPSISGSWLIINSTSGNYTITAKTSTGNGLQLYQGASSIVFCDGSVLWRPYESDPSRYDTIESLRTSTTDAPFVTITAYRAGGKKINALLYKDGSGAQTATGDAAIISALASNTFTNASGNTYKYSVIQVITPFHFAAYGDGTTTGIDAPAIDSAILFRHNAGGGVVYIPDAIYLLDTVTGQTTNPYYAYLHDDITIICESQGNTIFKVANGQNAAHAGTTGPNIFATDQTTPLTNFHFRNGKVDWNGANNLLTSSDSARNNASIMSVYGGINCSVDNIWVYETPGNQCVFFPAQSDQGQRDISITNSRFENSGSGLSGNYNIDHSSVYCNGVGLLYENNRFIAPSANQVNGACYEMHGDGIARGNRSENYMRAFWISADIQNARM